MDFWDRRTTLVGNDFELSGIVHAYIRVCHLSKIMAMIALTDN
jgi:hypothetical protein